LNRPKQQPKQTPDNVKRHVKDKLFQDYAAPASRPIGGEEVGKAQRAWLLWRVEDRTRVLDYYGIPHNQAHLFNETHWLVLPLYLRRKIKGFFRKSIPSDHPLVNLRYE
jgi:hypothetical protein